MSAGGALDGCAREASSLAKRTQSRWNNASDIIGGQVHRIGDTEHIARVSLVLQHASSALESASAEIGAAMKRL